MIWQVLAAMFSLAAAIVGSISSKTAFTTPPIYPTIGGTKWAVTTNWSPVPPT